LTDEPLLETTVTCNFGNTPCGSCVKCQQRAKTLVGV
jgi:7-cyano-7-deazaguanine synthase in queuosine biosynthesis